MADNNSSDAEPVIVFYALFIELAQELGNMLDYFEDHAQYSEEEAEVIRKAQAVYSTYAQWIADTPVPDKYYE